VIQRWTHGDTCGEEYNCEPKKDSEGELVLYADVERLTKENGEWQERVETLQHQLTTVRQELINELGKNALTPTGIERLESAERQLVAKVERLKAKRDHAREALQDEVRLRGELQNRAEAAERKLKETRKELSTVKIQMWLIRLGRDWWILQASRAMSPERFKELQDVPADEKARAALAEGAGKGG